MTLIEVFVPKGSLSEADRDALGEHLATELLSGEGDVVRRARAMAWVLIHEPRNWTVGGSAVASIDPPRFIVRLTVPGGHMNDAQRAEAVARITRALSSFAGDSQRLYRHPHAWVQIVEAPDGSLGLFGQVLGNADLVQLIVDPAHEAVVRKRAHATPADGKLVDPICGMTVELTDTALTLELDGEIVAFCSTACRDAFAEAHAIP